MDRAMLYDSNQKEMVSAEVFPAPYDTQELFRVKLNEFISISLEELIGQIEEFIAVTERNDLNLINSQQGVKMQPEEANKFFRGLERHQNNTLILQYMLCFLTHLPRGSDITHDLADPFKQFKSFILFNLKLLTQPDVIDSIFKKLRNEGYLKSENHVRCRLWIYKKYRETLSVVQQAHVPDEQNWKKLFSALKLLSLFWFSVNNHDMTKVRKVDVFVYLLSQYLMKKY